MQPNLGPHGDAERIWQLLQHLKPCSGFILTMCWTNNGNMNSTKYHEMKWTYESSELWIRTWLFASGSSSREKKTCVRLTEKRRTSEKELIFTTLQDYDSIIKLKTAHSALVLQALCHDRHRLQEPVGAVVEAPGFARVQRAATGPSALLEAHFTDCGRHGLDEFCIHIISNLLIIQHDAPSSQTCDLFCSQLYTCVR